MKHLTKLASLALASLVVGSLALPSLAQFLDENRPPQAGLMRSVPGADRPGSDPLQLLTQSKQVQEELNLTPAQIEQLRAIDAKARKQMNQSSRASASELQKMVGNTQAEVAKVLSTEQLTRFRQILLQVNGPVPEAPPAGARGATDPLRVTPAQQQALSGIRDKNQSARANGLSRSRSNDPAAVCQSVTANRQRLEASRQAEQEQILATMTPEQRATLEQLKGSPIELEAVPPCGATSR